MVQVEAQARARDESTELGGKSRGKLEDLDTAFWRKHGSSLASTIEYAHNPLRQAAGPDIPLRYAADPMLHAGTFSPRSPADLGPERIIPE